VPTIGLYVRPEDMPKVEELRRILKRMRKSLSVFFIECVEEYLATLEKEEEASK